MVVVPAAAWLIVECYFHNMTYTYALAGMSRAQWVGHGRLNCLLQSALPVANELARGSYLEKYRVVYLTA